MITASVVVTAGVSAFVVVVAVKISFDLKRTVNIALRDLPDISGSSADDLYPGISERVDGSAADTAADEDFDLFKREQRCEGTMAGTAA